MPDIDLHGIFPPITTPFIDGKVAHDKLASNIEKWGKTGLKGLLVLGSNGEYVYLSDQEKREVIETAVGAAPPDMLTMAGTGCESTRATIEMTNACAKRGARLALVVTPHYYGGRMQAAALIEHFTAVADESAIPILLYNVPKFTHITLTADVVSELSQHPNIVGLKESSGNLNLLGQYINCTGSDFNLMVGSAGVLFAGLSIGCVGGILALSNLAPDKCIKMYADVGQGNFEAARQLQLRMLPVNNAVTATYGIPGLKAAMDMLGYFGGDPRPPLLPATKQERSEIKEILQKAELL
jgi:4-hydroxy-2-oxoglutarate aldolase